MLPSKLLQGVLVKAILPTATTVLVAIIIWPILYRWASSTVVVTGPMNTGWPFTVVAMDGSEPADLAHEWSGSRPDFGAADSNSGSDPVAKAAAREALESQSKRLYVWADTGQASKPLRYHLTPADVEKANSQLDDSDPEHYRNVNVELLDNDPIGKHQTVRVIDSDEDDDVISVYRVEDERVRPVGWARCRPGMAVVPMLLIICLPVFVVAAVSWRHLLGARLLSHPPSSANP